MRSVLLILLVFHFGFVQSQNQLMIPPALTGTNFNLTVQTGVTNFYDSTFTPTYGINGSFLSPTIIVNKGDSITLNVINQLPVTTTMHWHGLHVSAKNDGGPHQEINPSSTWSPSFKIRNMAATYWYHPHGAGYTEQQVSKGLAGLFIVKDSAESAILLPRTYGVDDIPIIVQTRAFDVLQQIAIATDMDTAIFVNGTLNSFFNAPAQVIRFRLLNGSSLRSFNFGFSNNLTFYQIATDGGLKDSALALTRLLLSPGERAEILVDFAGMENQTLFLKSYASEIPEGIYGSAVVGSDTDPIHEYADNDLNGSDFNILQFNVVAPTSSPVTSIPLSLVPFTPFNPNTATRFRTIVMDTLRLLPIDKPNRAEGPFGLNGVSFNLENVNEIVHLNTTEIWTLVNKTLIAHPFHIHDIQFNVIEKSGLPPKRVESGWKDVILVLPQDSVKFITRFTTFADHTTPYMYHCHLLHHEDDGMMGSFLVVDTTATGLTRPTDINDFSISPNPFNNELTIVSLKNETYTVNIINAEGKQILSSKANGNLTLSVQEYSSGIYYIKLTTKSGSAYKKVIKLNQ